MTSRIESGSTPSWRSIPVAVVIALPALVLVGWMTEQPLLRTGGFGGVLMRPNAAVAMLFAGLALLMSRPWAVRALSSVPFAIGLLTTAEYVFASDFGIDALLFDPVGDQSMRMSVRAAVASALAGAAGLAIARPALARILAVATGFIAGVSLVAWAYGAEFLPHQSVTPIAASTAVTIIAWAIAFFVRKTRPGIAALSGDDRWAAAMRRITVASVTIPVALGGLCLGAARLQWFDLPFAVALIVTASGLTLAMTTSRFVTRLKASESGLRRSEARFRSLFETNIIGVSFCDANGSVASANDAFRQLFGLTEADIPGWSWGAKNLDRAAATELAESGRLAPHERECVRTDGSRFTGVVAMAAIEEETGISTNLAFVVDVSEKAEARRALERVRDILSARVAELENVDDTSGAIEDLAARLAGANEELETFSYSVSHDLRAPLRAVDGFSRELLVGYGEQLDATGRNYLSRIRAAAQRMSVLIDDLLSLSRVSRKPLRREPVDVGALALEIAAERNATCVNVARSIEALADPRLLRIVLENLIGNALKFSAGRASDARIDVFDAGDGVIAIRDNGTGFDMQYVHKIFAPFQRLHSSEYEGTGIGLAIVQRIVHRHGGSIRAESEPGKGATFFFDLGEPCLPHESFSSKTIQTTSI